MEKVKKEKSFKKNKNPSKKAKKRLSIMIMENNTEQVLDEDLYYIDSDKEGDIGSKHDLLKNKVLETGFNKTITDTGELK